MRMLALCRAMVESNCATLGRSTFKNNVRPLFEAGFSDTIGISKKRITLIKLIEWDLSVVAEYRIIMVGQLHLQHSMKQLKSKNVADAVAKRILTENPHMSSRCVEKLQPVKTFTCLARALPQLLSTATCAKEAQPPRSFYFPTF